MTTTIMVGIQNSVLVLESSNRYKVHEALKGTDPQSIESDALNPDRAYCVLLVMACGKPMIVARLGVILEKMIFPVHMLCLLQLVP